MGVDSYLELYTTLVGWSLYNVFWDVLISTGIAYIPFLWILIENVIEPIKSMEAHAGTGASVRRMEVDIVIAMSVIVLAAQPFIPLSANTLVYTKPCVFDPTANRTVANAVGVRPWATGTSYDGTFAGSTMVVNTVQVPIWWYATLSIAGGINRAVIIGIPCVEDLRLYSQMARSTSISDPSLRREYDRFASECYVPSLSKFQREQPSIATITGPPGNYGVNDPNWIGSHAFQNLPGYYYEFRATDLVQGCPFDPLRDTEYDGVSPGAGRPTCLGWWTGSECTTGLRDKLIDASGLLERATAVRDAVFGPGALTATQVGDLAIQNLATNGPANWTGVDYGGSAPVAAGGVGAASIGASGIAAGAAGAPVATTMAVTGVTMAAKLSSDLVGYYMNMYMIRHGAPMAQALILMGIYMLLPLAIVLTRYALPPIFIIAIAILAIKFWSTLWMVSWWVDQNLFRLMYPNAGILLGNGSWGIDRLILDMLTTSLYVVLPLIFSVVLGYAGVKIGAGLEGAVGSLTKPAAKLGDTVGKTTGSNRFPTSSPNRRNAEKEASKRA